MNYAVYTYYNILLKQKVNSLRAPASKTIKGNTKDAAASGHRTYKGGGGPRPPPPFVDSYVHVGFCVQAFNFH